MKSIQLSGLSVCILKETKHQWQSISNTIERTFVVCSVLVETLFWFHCFCILQGSVSLQENQTTKQQGLVWNAISFLRRIFSHRAWRLLHWSQVIFSFCSFYWRNKILFYWTMSSIKTSVLELNILWNKFQNKRTILFQSFDIFLNLFSFVFWILASLLDNIVVIITNSSESEFNLWNIDEWVWYVHSGHSFQFVL